MKIVILGCGRVGSRLALMLQNEGHIVNVVDKNRESFKRLGNNFKGRQVGGLGIDQDILKKADIEGAAAFIALTNGDNTNIMASQIAKEIFKVPKVIARIYDPIREYAYRSLGLQTLSTTTLGAKIIRNTIIGEKPDINELEKILGIEEES